MNATLAPPVFPARAIRWRASQVFLPPIVVGVGYYLGCLAGFAARFPSSGISFFWPPTALLTAALLLTARRTWPGLLAAAFAAHAIAHAQNGVPLVAWPIQFLGNAVQAALAAVLVRRYSTGNSIFSDLRHVLTFILGACVVAPAIASLIPAYAYVHLGWAPDFTHAWVARSVSNAAASLTLVPSIVMAWRYLWPTPHGIPRRIGEYGILLIGIFVAHTAAGYIERTDVLGLLAVLYAPIPFLVWATVRFGGAGLSMALLWTTFLTISTAMSGLGPLALGASGDTVVGIQIFLVMTAVPMMLIAGLLEQNRARHLALVELERQKSAILGAHPDLMFLQTRDGVYLHYYAKTAADLLVSPEAFLGRKMRDVLPPDLNAAFAQAFETATLEEPVVIEYTLPMNGTLRRYEARIIGVDRDRVLSVVREITERWQWERSLREAQQRYALATAVGGIGVWDFHVPTGTVHVEGAVHALLGYGNDEIGRHFSDWERVIFPADREEVRARFAARLSESEPSADVEFRMIHKDGSLRWFVSAGAVAERVDGVPTRLIGTLADITERKASEHALHEANDALIRMGRIAALAELSGSISHELQQPLAAIAANANACLRWLDSQGSVEDVREALADVAKDAQRANYIVERTHEMFTNKPVRTSVLDLNRIIRNVLEMTSGRLRERDVQLELRLEEELSAVSGDMVQIQQVLLNLIGNALEAMDGITGRPRVLRISSRWCRGGAIVSVRDTGRGFVSPGARRVFEPYYTTKPGGVGMGLTISRSIITSHGGSLWAVANVDHGATFRFRLSLSDLGSTQRQAAPAARRVLIVDDHEEMRKSTGRLVSAWGHKVALAEDGPRALAIAESFHPDAAILDISLEGMTGIELARRLRDASFPRRPFLIALTAYREPETRAACLAAGFDAFLIKTGDVAELERLLAGRP